MVYVRPTHFGKLRWKGSPVFKRLIQAMGMPEAKRGKYIGKDEVIEGLGQSWARVLKGTRLLCRCGFADWLADA